MLNPSTTRWTFLAPTQIEGPLEMEIEEVLVREVVGLVGIDADDLRLARRG